MMLYMVAKVTSIRYWSMILPGPRISRPPTHMTMHDSNQFSPQSRNYSKRPYMHLQLAGWLVLLSLSLSQDVHDLNSFGHRQTESIAYLSSQRCDRLGEAQLCPWDRRVGVKASVDPRAHVHPPVPQVPYSPLFPVQADTARTAPSSNFSSQRTRIFLLLLLLVLLLFFLLTPTRENAIKVQRQNCSATPHSRIHHLRSPNTKPTFFTLKKQNPLTAFPIRRSANPNFATYAATSAAPMHRVAHPVCPSPALASSRADGRTDGLETRPRGLVRGLLHDCVVKLRQDGHSTWLACWVVMTAYLWNSRFSTRPFCWRGKDTLVSLLVTTTPY